MAHMDKKGTFDAPCSQWPSFGIQLILFEGSSDWIDVIVLHSCFSFSFDPFLFSTVEVSWTFFFIVLVDRCAHSSSWWDRRERWYEFACLRVNEWEGERAEAKTIPVGSWAERIGVTKKAWCANKLSEGKSASVNENLTHVFLRVP